MIPDILAERYASKAIKDIWSAEGKILLERNLWIAVMKAQKELGLDIPQEAIDAYERVKTNIRVDEINKREKITRHDVKARIEEFCELAGYEHIHKGMTSRDLTECVEQLQIYESLKIVRTKAVAALYLLSKTARKHKATVLAARTHNVIAQLTTFGKRLAEFGRTPSGQYKTSTRSSTATPSADLKARSARSSTSLRSSTATHRKPSRSTKKSESTSE